MLIALYSVENRSMNAPLAHSPFGGSVAARILRCPASVSLGSIEPLGEQE
jgi:hypothetical protein